jgi:hypothetical protein
VSIGVDAVRRPEKRITSGPLEQEDTMRDTDQHDTDTELDRPIHWIDRFCASAWVRVL